MKPRPSRGPAWVRRAVRPLRRQLAWLVLVDEEQMVRERSIAELSARMDLVVQELWRRMEGVTGRHAMAIQETRDELERMRTDLDALLLQLGTTPETSRGDPAA